MRLLVAVSNEPLAHAIHGALLAGRHEVSLASTGSIALAAVAKESFDAVILDESLLGISTEQLIESLRNARVSVKILLLTSTPLSKTIGEGSRWRALPDEYAPIEETPYSSFSANSRANNSDAEAEQRSDNAAASAQANVRRPDAALSKPFSDGELLSYVGSLATDSPAMIIRGNLTLDTTNHKAYYASTHSPVWNTVCLKRWSRLMASSSTPTSWSNLSAAHSSSNRAYSRTPSTHWIRSSPAPASS